MSFEASLAKGEGHATPIKHKLTVILIATALAVATVCAGAPASTAFSAADFTAANSTGSTAASAGRSPVVSAMASANSDTADMGMVAASDTADMVCGLRGLGLSQRLRLRVRPQCDPCLLLANPFLYTY